MWFRDLALLKSGVLFLCFHQVTPHSSLFGYSKGEMCSWKEKCAGESRSGWAVCFHGGRTLTWVCSFVASQMHYTGSS